MARAYNGTMKSCPCHSGKVYSECCEPLHKGTTIPNNAVALMQSRYAAYALHLAKYIMMTTHPDHVHLHKSQREWRDEILQFCRTTQFNGLEILDFFPQGDKATVTFKAILTQGHTDTSFVERSLFHRVGKRWLYVGPLALPPLNQ